jgi:hypothetical protein
MTTKIIKNEQWSVRTLISKINNKEIIKPKFQRKKKWNIIPKKDTDTIPNEKSYIQFLYDTNNSVHAITFGQESNANGIFYSNIDGNNRINAISHFMEKPFEIFPEYLNDLFNLFDYIKSENTCEIKKIFESLSYDNIINIKTPAKFFKKIDKTYLFHEIQSKLVDIEEEIETIQTKLMINKNDHFDSTVKINVNLFEGYTTDELCKIFEDINKFNSKLTETELLACRLYNITDFEIYNNSFKSEIKDELKLYYEDKSNNEILDCYQYNINNDVINAHDFIVSFQNLCNKKYKIIEPTDVKNISLYFKLFKIIYGNLNETTFNSKNINDFISNIIICCEILIEVNENIFTNKINDKLFNKSCQSKISTLKKNNFCKLFCCIIGYLKKNTDRNIIKKELEKCLLYHFMINDIKKRDDIEDLKIVDSMSYKAGGGFIETESKKILNFPEHLNSKLSIDKFNELITKLFEQNNNPYPRYINNKKQNEKRRTLKFYEKTLMFYYYKQKMPTNMLDNFYSIEHICPNSSDWDGELDKDRIGNLIPIISQYNSGRGNSHIKYYYNENDTYNFFKFIKDIIPSIDKYDNIMCHNDKKVEIINIDKYNELCSKNETIYKDNFLKQLFP